MLKYKNRVTPNIYTLEKLIISYKKKNTPRFSSLTRLSAFWTIQSVKTSQPSFKSLFTNVSTFGLKKWTVNSFITPLRKIGSKKRFTPLFKTLIFKKFISTQTPKKSFHFPNPYTQLLSSNLTLIGKPFNFKNPYFFISKNYTEKTRFLRPFFKKSPWKTYFLKDLKNRFTFDTNHTTQKPIRSNSLMTKSFGGPVPSTGTLYTKPYFFTNSWDRYPSANNFSISLLNGVMPIFKFKSRNYNKRRYSWPKLSSQNYKPRLNTQSLVAFNTLSNLRQIKKQSFVSNQQETHNQLTILRNYSKDVLKHQNLRSKHFLVNTLKTLILKIRSNKSLKHLDTFSINLNSSSQYRLKSSKVGLVTALTNVKSFNGIKVSNRPARFHKKLPRVIRKLKKKFKMVLRRPLRRRRRRRARFLKQGGLTTFIFSKPSILRVFLTRKRRWGRKFLRRLALKKSINKSTFSLILLKTLRFPHKLAPSSRAMSKINYSQINKKFLWRKFMKWRKVKKLKRLALRQKSTLLKFFKTFYATSFKAPLLNLKRSKLLLVKWSTSSKLISILPKLFNSNQSPLTSKTLTYFGSSWEHLSDKVRLRSRRNLNFIFPLYGFLFITSNKLTTFSLATSQLLSKKTAHSFFYLDDLKSFVAGKHSSVSNDYVSFFSQSNNPDSVPFTPLNDSSNLSMIDFLARAPGSLLDNVSTPDYDQMRDVDPRVPRIKFKPGYTRIWRKARMGVKDYFQIKFQYQHRLTRFLPHFYKLSRVSLIKSTEMKLENLLLATHLLPDWKTCTEFTDKNLVFLNGKPVFNIKVYVVKNDLLQILISMKYYILFKWMTNWEMSKNARLNHLLYLSRLKTKRTFRKKLPDWVLRRISYPYDVPKYLEVDFLTLSAFVLYEPYLPTDFTHIYQKFSRSPIYNVYNWKYLT